VVALTRVDEEHAEGEQGVEERRVGGEDLVAQALVQDEHEVVVAVVGVEDLYLRSQPFYCSSVRLGARAVAPLQRLVFTQPLDEVRGQLPRHVLAVVHGFVTAGAGLFVESWSQEATEKRIFLELCNSVLNSVNKK
jgi:hypothetical protein